MASGKAVGQALGLRLDGSTARVFVELSDGEMQEGSTWEAAMSASHFKLDGLVALIDCNGIQADGPVVLDMEPVADKWRAFGWETHRDRRQRHGRGRRRARCWRAQRDGKPKAIVLRTLPGKGVPTHREQREVAFLPRRRQANGTRIIAEFEAERRSRHDG